MNSPEERNYAPQSNRDLDLVAAFVILNEMVEELIVSDDDIAEAETEVDQSLEVATDCLNRIRDGEIVSTDEYDSRAMSALILLESGTQGSG